MVQIHGRSGGQSIRTISNNVHHRSKCQLHSTQSENCAVQWGGRCKCLRHWPQTMVINFVWPRLIRFLHRIKRYHVPVLIARKRVRCRRRSHHQQNHFRYLALMDMPLSWRWYLSSCQHCSWLACACCRQMNQTVSHWFMILRMSVDELRAQLSQNVSHHEWLEKIDTTWTIFVVIWRFSSLGGTFMR